MGNEGKHLGPTIGRSNITITRVEPETQESFIIKVYLSILCSNLLYFLLLFKFYFPSHPSYK